ncbi:MAG: hypothetical protein PHU34_01575 [Candidatus Methanoperedens sp.]|nr:hypothetical protein [Candidatus Methanoperedens sp.]
MVDWKNITLVYEEDTIWHIEKHRIDISEVHKVLAGYFTIQRRIVKGVLRYLVLGESYGRILVLVLEPVGRDEMLLITAYDAPESRKRLYREMVKR